MTQTQARETIKRAVKELEAAVSAASTAALRASMAADVIREKPARPRRKGPAGPAQTVPFAPDTWSDDQRACHRADDLDLAFHAASCLSGGWYRRPVVIWCATVADEERYWILPEDAPRPAAEDGGSEFHRCYRVEHISDEEA